MRLPTALTTSGVATSLLQSIFTQVHASHTKVHYLASAASCQQRDGCHKARHGAGGCVQRIHAQAVLDAGNLHSDCLTHYTCPASTVRSNMTEGIHYWQGHRQVSENADRLQAGRRCGARCQGVWNSHHK